VLATILKNSKLRIKNVGLNPSRIGILQALQKMHAKIKIVQKNQNLSKKIADSSFEPYGDIMVESSNTIGGEFQGDIIPNIIDEIPILAILAAFSKGETIFRDVGELRVKESDRIQAIYQNLKNCGIRTEQTKTSLKVFGTGSIPEGGSIKSYKDHRIAMAFSILGLASQKGVILDEATWISTSFPNFFDLIQKVIH
jgi:3-phosphoshikimate 1-carboxyvinyltransferase